ncbi:uncharacterized protein K444DRAFT_273105 [Hyaloscypha bicolor E]|uniref:Uncharacterized protein n=1 Tax=Hyaloscypha bicolor E TaxID=1095630 RepID=A0A2J6SIL1_9HELO|nr:uncharacterized protein K444DRAFT_273105 [Hyaloscypha bicolor E]PMD50608.1 hypothetical protein K444DRAFT_273105 [Hyaloscypha bicolor E]
MGRRSQKPKDDETGCWKCELQGLQCDRGTCQSGYCIPCGHAGVIYSPNHFEGFFSYALRDHMLLLVGRKYLGLNARKDVLEIDITRSKGLSKPHQLVTWSKVGLSNNRLNYQLDKIVFESYLPNVRCRTATTSLITSALFGRGYLTLLFPCNVKEGAGIFSDTICLFNLALARLHESIDEVTNGFNQDVQRNERYWAEAASSLAILYPGLLHAQDRLDDHTTQPFFGDLTLADLLAGRIKSTLAHFNHLLCHGMLRCDLEWTSVLEGSLEDMRTNVEISSLAIRAFKQHDLMSTRSLSTSSSGSSLICPTNTPPSSIEGTPPEKSVTASSGMSRRYGWLDTGPRPPLTTSTKRPAPLWDPFQDPIVFHLGPSSPTLNGRHTTFSKSATIPYGDTFNISAPPPLSTIYTSQLNDFSDPVPLEPFPQDNGSSDITSPESFPNWQALGMSSDVPSEIEQIHSHVSLPLSHTSDLGKETSDLDSRDLFSDPQYPYTSIIG